MLNHPPTVDAVLAECARIPLDPDPVLAALAVAVHLEDSLDLVVPAALLDPDHLLDPAAREATVRRLLGDR